MQVLGMVCDRCGYKVENPTAEQIKEFTLSAPWRSHNEHHCGPCSKEREAIISDWQDNLDTAIDEWRNAWKPL